MKIIIVGCGKLGSSLALELEKEGHEITVISDDPGQFAHLGTDFSGRKIEGYGIDRDTLEDAGINRVDGIIACTESDEKNAVVARIARSYYHVPKVISRLFDSRKASIYNALGIQVIASTNWAIARTKEILTASGLETVLSIGNGPIEIVRAEVPELLIGRSVIDVTRMGEIRVAAISRGNKSMFPVHGTVFEKNDIIYFAVISQSMETLRHILGL